MEPAIFVSKLQFVMFRVDSWIVSCLETKATIHQTHETHENISSGSDKDENPQQAVRRICIKDHPQIDEKSRSVQRSRKSNCK